MKDVIMNPLGCLTMLDKYFNCKRRNVTIGVEVEMYLWDLEAGSLLEDEHLLNDCLAKLPITVTRDYYVYQLEVRTNPHKNPEDLVKEFIDTLNLCRKVFSAQNIRILPVSWLGYGEMFNGVHFHFRNGNSNHFDTTMFNMYPFVLALTDCFRNTAVNDKCLSNRFVNSQHISLPNLTNITRSNRYSDIAVNRHRENDRHRLKSVNTIEVRTFDVPYDIDYLRNLTELMFNVFKHINYNEKIKLYEDEETRKRFVKSREEIMIHAFGYNHYLEMLNVDIYKWLCNRFNIKPLIVPVVFNKECKLRNQSDFRNNARKMATRRFLKVEDHSKDLNVKEVLQEVEEQFVL